MFRVLAASLLVAAVALPTAPVSADMKSVSAKSGSHKAGKLAKRTYDRPRPTALAVPRCRMIRRTSYHVHWRGLACPRIAWVGSAPRQPWSYAIFRRHARWDQQSHLWQSHIRPGRSHPAIYWGY